MPETKDMYCWRMMMMIAAWGTYIVAFSISSNEWVVTDKDVNWGLWSGIRTFNGTVTEFSLHPTDQPGYYNAVRTLSCFALVLYVSFFFMCDPNKGLGAGANPVKICVLINILVTIMLIVLGVCYKDDDRWKDDSPELGWCFYVCMSSDIIVFFTALLAYKIYTVARPANKKKVAPKKQTPKPKQDQKKANEAKKHTPPPNKTEDPKKTEEKKKEGDSSGKTLITTVALVNLNTSSDPPAAKEEGASSTPVDIEAQNLSLDPYEIPGTPVDGHLAPMPDYWMAAGDETMDDVMAANPKVAHPESIWKKPKKVLKYLAAYAKSAATGSGVSGSGGENEGGKAKYDGGESGGGKGV